MDVSKPQLGRKTVRVEKEGDEDCEHNWSYEAKQYLSYPPQSRKICENCGRVEWEQSQIDSSSSFVELYEEHHSSDSGSE